MENTIRKTLIIVAKKGFETRFPFSVEPSAKEQKGNLVKLTFNSTTFEINKLFHELRAETLTTLPSQREILEIADETGILHKENLRTNLDYAVSIFDELDDIEDIDDLETST